MSRKTKYALIALQIICLFIVFAAANVDELWRTIVMGLGIGIYAGLHSLWLGEL